MHRPSTASTLIVLAILLQGCSGGGNDSAASGTGGGSFELNVPTTDDNSFSDTDSIADDGTAATPIAGDIARYGVIALGDEGGEATDLIARFTDLSSPVSIDAFGTALDADRVGCTIEDSDGVVRFSDLNIVYVPTPSSVTLVNIGAGDTVMLSSAAGSWVELQPRNADGAYELPPTAVLPSGAIPDGLMADVTGDAFPAFTGIVLPDVETLTEVRHDGGAGIGIDTRFNWTAGTSGNARIRIKTATAGGFFLDRSTNVDCLVPDTGEFTFPRDVKAALGSDFDGAAPMFSRLSVATEQQGDALLVLVRESLVP